MRFLGHQQEFIHSLCFTTLCHWHPQGEDSFSSCVKRAFSSQVIILLCTPQRFAKCHYHAKHVFELVKLKRKRKVIAHKLGKSTLGFNFECSSLGGRLRREVGVEVGTDVAYLSKHSCFAKSSAPQGEDSFPSCVGSLDV